MRFVSVLRCADGTFYVGQTASLRTRLTEHQSGAGASHVANRLPVEMVYAEEYRDARAALKRERQLKRWSHKKKEALVTRDISALKSS